VVRDTAHVTLPPDAVERVRRGAPQLERQALLRLEDVEWFRALGADVRSRVGSVIRAGVDAFVTYLAHPTGEIPPAQGAFAVVPAEMARAVTLEQTVELIRVAFGAVEDAVPALVEEHDRPAVTGALAMYSREIAFAAASVYARAAEQRGAWDARLETLIVDALLSGADERVITARASALGRPVAAQVHGLALLPSDADSAHALEVLQLRVGRSPVLSLAVPHEPYLLGVLTPRDDPLAEVGPLLPLGWGAVVGPPAAGLAAAGPSLRAALAGAAVVPAWRGRPGPLLADELLAERAVAGDALARQQLVEVCYKSLTDAGTALVSTAEAVLASGGSLEMAARALPVHVNTLRYRLNRIQDVTGWDLRLPADRFALSVAMVLARTTPVSTQL
jgi:PucR C-terminal helix-turn-helix domain